MNIFYLDPNPKIAASYHCDKHVGKMLLEACQILATCFHHYHEGHKVTYRPTHANHPCTLWVTQSASHYKWLAELADALGDEFIKRYGKVHRSQQVLHAQLMDHPHKQLDKGWIDPPQVMPDELQLIDTVKAYQHFYITKMDRMEMVYFHGNQPPPYFFPILQSVTK